jgi:hypothetical protein
LFDFAVYDRNTGANGSYEEEFKKLEEVGKPIGEQKLSSFLLSFLSNEQ